MRVIVGLVWGVVALAQLAGCQQDSAVQSVQQVQPGLAAVESPKRPEVAAAPPPPVIDLVGTVIGTRAQDSFALLSVEAGKPMPFYEGDPIVRGWVVKTIASDLVVATDGERSLTLRPRDPGVPASNLPQSAASMGGPAIATTQASLPGFSADAPGLKSVPPEVTQENNQRFLEAVRARNAAAGTGQK